MQIEETIKTIRVDSPVLYALLCGADCLIFSDGKLQVHANDLVVRAGIQAAIDSGKWPDLQLVVDETDEEWERRVKEEAFVALVCELFDGKVQRVEAA